MRDYAKVFFLAAVLLLGVEYTVGHGCRTTSPEITGTYTFLQNPSSTLEIQAEGGVYIALLSGGSSPAAGAAAPADCYIRARGKLQGQTLTADFVPLETDTFSYSKAQADRETRHLTIVFGPQSAEVIQADTFGYCGVGSDFVGRYRRQAAQK